VIDNYDSFTYNLVQLVGKFTDQITAEIDPEIDPDHPVYKNIGKTNHSGLETSLEYYFNDQFNIYTSYSYLKAEFDNNPDYGDNTLRKTPENTINSGIRYGFKFGLSAAIDYKFVDEFFMDNEELNLYKGYSTLNLKLLYKRNGFTATFAVNNLLDENYATYAYASSSYDRATRQTVWSRRFIPGWPININTSISYRF
jgi:outer membrane receptor protein involved in Fe transport